jgi:hypothetical protein
LAGRRLQIQFVQRAKAGTLENGQFQPGEIVDFVNLPSKIVRHRPQSVFQQPAEQPAGSGKLAPLDPPDGKGVGCNTVRAEIC